MRASPPSLTGLCQRVYVASPDVSTVSRRVAAVSLTGVSGCLRGCLTPKFRMSHRWPLADVYGCLDDVSGCRSGVSRCLRSVSGVSEMSHEDTMSQVSTWASQDVSMVSQGVDLRDVSEMSPRVSAVSPRVSEVSPRCHAVSRRCPKVSPHVNIGSTS